MRKMLYAFVAVCLLLAAVPAMAAPPTPDWHMYWVGTDRSEAYATVDAKGYQIKAPQALVSTYVEDMQGNYSMVGEVYDCSTLRWTSLGQFDYDKNDKLLRSFNPPDAEKNFKPAGIRDRQVVVMNTVCAGGAPRSSSAVQASVLDLEKQLKAMQSK